MALTKPRRTHETSGAMDSRSMTGPFFEVPSNIPNEFYANEACLASASAIIPQDLDCEIAGLLALKPQNSGSPFAWAILEAINGPSPKEIAK